MLRRVGTTEICLGVRQISVAPPLLISITQGGSGGGGGGGGSQSIRSQLRALATHTPSLERLSQGAWL